MKLYNFISNIYKQKPKLIYFKKYNYKIFILIKKTIKLTKFDKLNL